VNQVFLLLGINLSHNSADELHPHGYGKEGFFWSFLAAIFIFVAGAAFSYYEGIRTLIQDEHGNRTVAELIVGFGVLGMAFAFESVSFMVAVRSIRKSAKKLGWTFVHYVRRSPDLSTKTVFWEDSAALIGLTLAALGLGLSEVFHAEVWDGLASVGIGLVLTAAALLLGAQSRSLLLGAAASRDVRQAIRETVEGFPDVNQIVRLLTMQLGVHSVLVTGEIEVRRHMDTDQIEALIVSIDARLAELLPEVTDTFWELRRSPDAATAAELKAQTSLTGSE
jgi:cation diffusion facilitator family transporter